MKNPTTKMTATDICAELIVISFFFDNNKASENNHPYQI